MKAEETNNENRVYQGQKHTEKKARVLNEERNVRCTQRYAKEKRGFELPNFDPLLGIIIL